MGVGWQCGLTLDQRLRRRSAVSKEDPRICKENLKVSTNHLAFEDDGHQVQS